MVPWITMTATAFWLGILTSISPCPLASNIAALSFLGKNISRRNQAVISGLLYTAGRTLVYVCLAVLIVGGALSIPTVALFLQGSMNRFLGPLLIAVGLVLLGVLRMPSSTISIGSRLEKLFKRGGYTASLLMGVVFALSFCPTSAALYFGSLIPLAVDRGSVLTLPAMYGVGTAAPVAVFAVLVAQGAYSAGKAFDLLTRFERWAKLITGIVFLLAGLHYILTYWFGISVWG